MKMRTVRFLFTIFAGVVAPLAPSFAWDYEGHRVVNHAALASLPTNFPAFVLAPEARERIAFLSGEPDRWRNTTDLPLRHCNGPDHYFDVDELAHYQLEASALSHFRYEFTAQLAAFRAKHPEKFPPDEKDFDRTKYLPGFLPWAVMENYAKLRSAFSYLKVFEEMGTPAEVAEAVSYLLSPRARSINGHVLVIDGGATTRCYPTLPA